MTTKFIENPCFCTDKCILEIDGRYFGYDSDPAYPETTYKEKEKAYVFKGTGQALEMTAWLSGEKFKIIKAN